MKLSTIKVKSSALKLTSKLAEDVRNNKAIVVPLLSKEINTVGDYLFLKEPLPDGTFTTKNTAKTFVRVISAKTFNVTNITNADITKFIDSNEENIMDKFIDFYNGIINDMVDNVHKVSAKKRLINDFSFEANPTIQVLEFEIINETNSINN